MFAWNKRTTALLLSIALTTQTFAGIVSQECKVSGETNFFPVGDERGHSVLTKKEVYRDCNITITTQGACKKWKEDSTEFYLDPSDYNTYKSNNNNGALGETFAIIGAYDQIGHLWSGWKGYCEKGTKHDFSWASDPMFWASLAMSAAMDGSNTKGSMLEGSMNSVNDAAGSAWQGLGNKIGMKLSKDFGKCLVAGGVDMAANVYKYFAPVSEEDCDPVDEFCDEQNNQIEEDSVFPIDEVQYNDLIEENPEYAEYIEILDNQEGVLTIRFKNPNEMPDAEQKTQNEMEEMRQKMKTMQFAISSAMVAIKMASCGATGGSVGSTSSVTKSTSTGRFSVKEGIGMAINSLPTEWLAPYGALIKAGLAVVLEFATSFQHINTCENEDDAKEAGSRHLKTYESLPYDLYQPTKQVCSQKKFFGSGCALDGYFYCCYDQILTKILVAQIKAQLGRDWSHCTGITLNDLNFVSFRQCTEADKQSGFDGTKVVLKYDEDGKLISPANWSDAKWLESFQHKRKCIDLTEFKENLEATFSQDIDFSDFDAIFSDTAEQIEPMAQ